MNIIVERSGHTGMPQQFGYRCDVNAVCDVIRCTGVPKHMGMDLSNTVPFGKVAEPARNAVWVDRLTIVACKNIACVNPAVSVNLFQKKLFLLLEF